MTTNAIEVRRCNAPESEQVRCEICGYLIDCPRCGLHKDMFLRAGKAICSFCEREAAR